MSNSLLVIVGRPNVGKSTLFNRIAGSAKAIVEDVAGVTRDANFADAQWEGKGFTVVDTGGFYPKPEEELHEQMKEQALFAVEEAEVVIHLLDGKEGLNPYDRELAEILRASGKTVLWAVNKIDAHTRLHRLYEFYDLGVELIPVSAATGYNFEELMERANARLPQPVPKEAAPYPMVAVVGKPNVGKSTLVNSLLGKKRMIVSPLPGTTRDAVDSVCSYYKRKYILIDTAGLRRKSRAGYSVERFAMLKAEQSIRRSDVSLVLLDATEGVTAEDQKIAGIVERYGKGALLLFNKWDLVSEPEAAYKTLMADIERRLWFFAHAPVITTSGLEKKRITKIFPVIDEVIKERRKKISTSELNRFIREIALPPYKGKKVKLSYISQVAVEPPAFALFTNIPDGLKDSSMRHIEARLREAYGFKGTPIRIYKKLKV